MLKFLVSALKFWICCEETRQELAPAGELSFQLLIKTKAFLEKRIKKRGSRKTKRNRLSCTLNSTQENFKSVVCYHVGKTQEFQRPRKEKTSRDLMFVFLRNSCGMPHSMGLQRISDELS